MDDAKNIVIIGGGIIGTLTAFHIVTHPKFSHTRDTVTLLEATAIAGGASGKGAGLLATWADPACLGPLSFQTHVELAERYDGAKNWGFRRVECAQAGVRIGGDDKSVNDSTNIDAWPAEIDWVERKMHGEYIRDGDGTANTAQIHPEIFTKKMLGLAIEHGLTVIMGTATSINTDPTTSAVSSVTYQPQITPSTISHLSATDVIVAAGPFTSRLLPSAPITGSRSHSIVIAPTRPITAHMLSPVVFTGPGLSATDSERVHNYQIYPRPDGTAFACGRDDASAVPDTTADVQVVAERITEVRDAGKLFSPDVIGAGEVLKEQACYRPYVAVEGRPRNSYPLVGFTHTKGLLLAAGHDEWGIQNSAGTGVVVSEMLMDGKATSADVGGLDPRLVMGKE